MNGSDVVVTGIGLVSPLGLHADEHVDGWLAGRCAARVAADPQFRRSGAELEARVEGFDRGNAITNRMLRKLLSTSAAYAVAAAGEALSDAGVSGDTRILTDCGLYVGSLSLEIDPETFLPPLQAALTADGQFDISAFARRGTLLLDPLFLVRALPNAGACGISVQHQVLGPNTNVTNGTTSGLTAVALAAAAIRRGDTQCAVAGGYDTLLVIDSIAEHLIAGRLADATGDPSLACRPFDRRRDGYVLGEGAAFLFLEAAERAVARNAHIYGTLCASMETTDTGLASAERAVALERAARGCLERAGVAPQVLGAVFGDGLGTEDDDLREAAALERVLGGAAVPFTAATAAIGFTGAASGVFSLSHCLIALRRGIAPALACAQPDPRCRVHLLPRHGTLANGTALVWNSDRGVKNVAMVVSTGS